MIVGMAYVVRRRDGRFEVRESVLTERGPRARSLANFSTLSEDVLARAEHRATRPFDRDAVASSALRRGAAVSVGVSAPAPPDVSSASVERFVAGTRRFAFAMEELQHTGRSEPGAVLIDLLGFADEVLRNRPARPRGPLRFPSLKALVATSGRR
jgi:hypothetical protein